MKHVGAVVHLTHGTRTEKFQTPFERNEREAKWLKGRDPIPKPIPRPNRKVRIYIPHQKGLVGKEYIQWWAAYPNLDGEHPQKAYGDYMNQGWAKLVSNPKGKDVIKLKLAFPSAYKAGALYKPHIHFNIDGGVWTVALKSDSKMIPRRRRSGTQ